MFTERRAEEAAVPALGSSAEAALQRHLSGRTGLLLLAMNDDARMVAVPASLPVTGHHVYAGSSAIESVVGDDQALVVDAWARAQHKAVVQIGVRLHASPDRIAPLTFFDLREDCGVHVLVLDDPEPERVLELLSVKVQARHGVAHVKRDAVAVFLEVDEETVALLGWPAAELLGKRTLDLVHPDDVERAVVSWMSMRAGVDPGRMRARYRHARGHYIWVEVTNDNRLDEPEACVVSEMVDISAEMADLDAIQERERQLERLAEALPIGICHLRFDHQVAYANPPLVDLLGPVSDAADLLGRVVATDRDAAADAIANAFRGEASTLEVGLAGQSGDEFVERRCELTLRTMTGDSGSVEGIVVCASDVTDRSRMRAELEHRASHDSLSGLLNRAATLSTLHWAQREYGGVTVAYIDVDGLKTINDELGHAAGDEILQVVAARLHGATRANDRLGRVGGDEFVMICPHAGARVDPDGLSARLTAAVAGEVNLGDHRVEVRASVGAASSSPDEPDIAAVLARADTAMYTAKRSHGRGRSGSG